MDLLRKKKKTHSREAVDFLIKSHLQHVYVTYTTRIQSQPSYNICPKILHRTHSVTWDELFTSANICQNMVITYTFKLKCQHCQYSLQHLTLTNRG